METYFSTYISGVSNLIPAILTKTLKNCEVYLNLDGLVCFETTSSVDQIKSLRFLNNTFVLIKSFDNLPKDPFKPIQLWALRNPYNTSIADYVREKYIKSFRIINSYENTVVASDIIFRTKLESKISREYRIRLNKESPDVEFWLLVRSEGYGFFGFRITNNSKVEHRSKGQLRPELASIMCLLSNPQAEDVFLDPFAGYGTIAIERGYYPHQKIIAVEKLSKLASKIPHKKIDVRKGDFFTSNFADKSITKIVTDPPWGIYNDKIDIREFYKKMFDKFHKILVDNGRIVLLIDRGLHESLDYYQSGFSVDTTNNILVSGKKATIVVLTKTSN